MFKIESKTNIEHYASPLNMPELVIENTNFQEN